MRDSGLREVYYANNVKAKKILADMGPPGVFECRPNQLPAFFRGDSKVGWTVLFTGAGFHLNDDQEVAVPCYQVQFAVACARLVIAGNHHVPLAFQETVGEVFSEPSARSVRLPALKPEAMSKPIPKSESGEHP